MNSLIMNYSVDCYFYHSSIFNRFWIKHTMKSFLVLVNLTNKVVLTFIFTVKVGS